MTKILIVDDEKSIRKTLREILEFEKYEIDEAKDGMECLAKFKRGKFDIVILDIKMPNLDGMETLERLQQMSPETPIVMISGHANIDTAIEAVKMGAFDFVSKPPDLNRLLITLKNALDKHNLISETKLLKRKVVKSSVQKIIGETPTVHSIRETIARVAPTEARVLVTGSNGTGKELVARWIHQKSHRKDNNIVEVNCAAIPSELIESELFGHEKGSFTSAVKQRIGKFEQANGGTLFLDEIGDMSLSAQAKVLRALQENYITRVGGEKAIQVDVRVVAATNKDLKKEIANGRFREDLYHRLAVIIVHVPGLNERVEDIPLLVNHFNEHICMEYGTPLKSFSPSALEALKAHNWTGNIRELRNVVERLIILCGQQITDKDVSEYVFPPEATKSRLEQLFNEFDNVDDLSSFITERWKKYKRIGL
jgi:DNA-binding NtrC family response regulator